jgi:hypothetical protein
MQSRTRLAAGVLAAASVLGFTVAQATAATTAQVQNGTLFITGTNGGDDITLLPSATGVLDIDITGDGVSDLSFDRSTSPRSTSRPAAGTTASPTAASSPTRSSRSTAAAATTR